MIWLKYKIHEDKDNENLNLIRRILGAVMNISQDDLKILKDFVWWTADKKTPYIVKGGIKDETYYIVVTDLKSAWFRKADKETILDEKEKFNRALQVQNFQGIVDLLVQPLSAYDKEADYVFELLNSDRSLVLELQTKINVYPFKWQFFLTKINDTLFFNTLVEDLVNPLLCTLKATEMRVNLLKRQFAELENDYKKKMNDKERQNYKSKIEDSEESWKFLIKDMPIDNKMSDFDLSEASNYFFREYTQMRLKSNYTEIRSFYL